MDLQWNPVMRSYLWPPQRPLPPLASELYECIYDFLSPVDMIAASHVSKSWRSAAQAYFSLSLLKLLHRYFLVREAEEFRQLQAAHAAVISGSSAIQFFERTFRANSDLDVYVEHAHGQAIGEFLERIGYTFAPRTPIQRSGRMTFIECYSRMSRRFSTERPAPYNWKGIGGVYDFTRDGQTVQLITTRGSVMQAILGFHSTAPMNIITSSHAYSLYPKATFQQRRACVITSTSTYGHDAAHQKYRERGWQIFRTVTAYEATHPKESEFAVGLRWLGDSKCMTVELPPLQLTHLPKSSVSWTSNSWSLDYSRLNEATMDETVVVSGIWKYSVLDEHVGAVLHSKLVKDLIGQLHNLTLDHVLGIVTEQYYSHKIKEVNAEEWFNDPAQHTLFLDRLMDADAT